MVKFKTIRVYNQIQSYLYWQSLGVPKSTLEEYKEVLLLTASHLVTPTQNSTNLYIIIMTEKFWYETKQKNMRRKWGTGPTSSDSSLCNSASFCQILLLPRSLMSWKLPSHWQSHRIPLFTSNKIANYYNILLLIQLT